MKPLYALHKDASEAILTAGSFEYGHKLNDWLRSLNIRAGDTITFGEVKERKEETDEVAA
jgi:hypothetical protein